MVARAHAAALAALATAGCAAIPQKAEWVEMRPLQVGAAPEVSAADRYYAAAVAAIGRRDYAAALEQLQLARARAPSDVRVFNAFGVVYDKLGRFDLSARYYAQAATLQPSSPIVAANVAYSAVLEKRVAPPVAGVQVAQAEAGVSRVAPPAKSSQPAPTARRTADAAPPPVAAIATVAPPVRLRAVSGLPAPPPPRAASQPAVSVAALAPKQVARPAAPDPAASLAAPIAARKTPAAAAPVSLVAAAASPTPAAKPQRSQLVMAAASTPEPAAPQHILHPTANPERQPPASGPPIRIAPASPAAVAPQRTVAQPAPANGSELAPVAGPPVRLARIGPVGPMLRPPVLRLTAAQPGSSAVVKLASNTAVPQRLPLLTGTSLLVINASGRQTGGAPVVTRLARLGWSVPRSARTAPIQSQTTIVFPARNAAVAYALARTLPYKVRLMNCAGRCERVSLIVGADALRSPKGRSAVRAKTA